MATKKTAVLCALMALAGVAGIAGAQCTTYIRTTGGGTVEPGVTDIGNHADDLTTAVALPFTVNYYGVDYNTAYICSNGWVGFEAAGQGYSNVCLAANIGAAAFNRVPGPVIFAHWDDLTTAGTGNGIFTSVTGDPGSQVFHIEWRTNHLSSTTDRADFEVRLFENNPRIEIVYGTITRGGNSATAGIQQTQGTFDQFSCNIAGGIQAGTMVRYFCDLANPAGSGSATPGTVQITGSTLLKVQVTPAQQPPSTGITVRANLTGINGSANQLFYDDGSNGDEAAGDNVYSYLTPINEPLTAGAVSLPYTVSDAQARTATGTIALTLLSAPTGGCCTGSGCQILSAYGCGQAGGTYNGNGTNCSIIMGTTPYATISGTGTLLTAISGCDDCQTLLPLPFTFNFYGTDYTQVSVVSNGFLQFTGNSTTFTNVPLPATAVPNNAIYPLWDDFNPLTQGDVYYQVDGTSPNQTLTIEWFNVSQYTGGGVWPITSENFQVVLFEGSNDIEFRYGTISAASTTGVDQGAGLGNDGGDYSVGIENATGTEAAWTSGRALGTGNMTLRLNSNTSLVNCNSCPGNTCGSSDYNGDGDFGTDQDIEAFFACIGGTCCETCFCQGSDFNGDGDFGTDQDIEAFFRVLGGNNC